MVDQLRRHLPLATAALSIVVALCLLLPSKVFAATQTSNQSLNVTATVYGPAPSTPAVILSPTNNTFVSVTPMVVSGTCGPGLLVKLFNNAQLVGSATCQIDGTFVINTSLNPGKNELTVLNYDTLDQAGPASPAVKATVLVPSNNQTIAKPRTRKPASTPSSSSPETQQPDQSITNFDNAGDQPRTSLTPTQVHAEWLFFFIDLTLLILLADLLLNRRRILRTLTGKRRRHKKPIF